MVRPFVWMGAGGCKLTKEDCMMYICSFCNTKKFSSQEKKYVYASSTKAVKVLVCASCHKAKLLEMETKAKEVLSNTFTLGVLKESQE